MTTINPESAARQLQQAQQQSQQIDPITAQLPGFDLTAGYAMADWLHRERVQQGAVAAGRKIGFTNPAMLARYGVEQPVWGYMYQHTVVYLKEASASIRIGHLTQPKIEPELAVHFHTAPPVNGDLLQILACIDWVAHTFEIVQSHYPDWKFTAADAVADSALHGLLLVGKPLPVAGLGQDPLAVLANFSVALSCNGALRESGTGANVLGSPLSAVAHLIAAIEAQAVRRPLQANELITTGTLTAAFPLQAGETWRTEVQGIALPGLEVSFTA
ncbi:2-keto-4-pentenoate hydratase [Herbaspirillum autotrophicum]|uniref:2-keto-4-pentenoate hydratase n=1 Tax=Herbaspirillum autotrophicum TaxID=180195 RepID=UPI00067CABEC|nr:fumarylacetoacetate hydrolase family protein [Herbaspirillum autotrophicum]